MQLLINVLNTIYNETINALNLAFCGQYVLVLSVFMCN
jgi:hypothetical protein